MIIRDNFRIQTKSPHQSNKTPIHVCTIKEYVQISKELEMTNRNSI